MMADVENNLGTTVNAGNTEEETRENWTWKDSVCCCCIFSFIFLMPFLPIVILLINLISKATKGELEYRPIDFHFENEYSTDSHPGKFNALDIVVSTIIVVLFILVICVIFCGQRKNQMKAELREEGIVRASGRHSPFTQ